MTSNPKEESLQLLASMGISFEEAKEASEALKTTRAKDDRICVCGHKISNHSTSSSGLISCVPSRLQCPCKRIHPVIRCDNLRPFMRKTDGHGVRHALVLGIAKAIEIGATVEWLENPTVCERCGQAARVKPVCVTKQGYLVPESVGWDSLICDECFKGL